MVRCYLIIGMSKLSNPNESKDLQSFALFDSIVNIIIIKPKSTCSIVLHGAFSHISSKYLQSLFKLKVNKEFLYGLILDHIIQNECKRQKLVCIHVF